ncbi:MAG: tetrathionate reductase family octaheme c-type cytochrome [Desulfonatronovibrionaceae bacterium]
MKQPGKLVLWILAATLLIPCIAAHGAEYELAPGREMAQQAVRGETPPSTVDHSELKPLQTDFESGSEVTRACLSCHNMAGEQLAQTIHWLWLDPQGGNETEVGKAGLVMNNFCINIQSNEPRCTSCHAGYGWEDKDFDFKDLKHIDCLVCHEQTGTYKKYPAGSGYPVQPEEENPDKPGEMGQMFSGKFLPAPDLKKVAQSVGKPTRRNCGSCHFYGGGGDGVKHGDLDSSMTNPPKNLDVHMAEEGQDFACQRCHTTRAHDISGRIYSTPAYTDRKSLIEDDLAAKIACESCHTATPHKSGQKANDHTDKVSCQACHIPEFARALPTKMWWDWSKAGQTIDGKAKVMGPHNRPVFIKKKGEFVWEKDVVPEYYWFAGGIDTVLATDRIDPSQPVKMAWPIGDKDDPNARIMPFKVHRGLTPYDPVQNNMVIPHLFPWDKNDTAAYWKGFDWDKAVEAAMDYAGVPFSGEVDFVETEYVYPTTHMVAPKEDSLRCEACHTGEGSRLSNLSGFYMPARDSYAAVNWIGWTVVVLSLVGVVIHAVVRIIARSRRES